MKTSFRRFERNPSPGSRIPSSGCCGSVRTARRGLSRLRVFGIGAPRRRNVPARPPSDGGVRSPLPPAWTAPSAEWPGPSPCSTRECRAAGARTRRASRRRGHRNPARRAGAAPPAWQLARCRRLKGRRGQGALSRPAGIQALGQNVVNALTTGLPSTRATHSLSVRPSSIAVDAPVARRVIVAGVRDDGG